MLTVELILVNFSFTLRGKFSIDCVIYQESEK